MASLAKRIAAIEDALAKDKAYELRFVCKDTQKVLRVVKSSQKRAAEIVYIVTI